MKLISWNVNGLRACIQKGFLEEFDRMEADFFCLQETKLQEGQIQLSLPGYYQYWNYAQKKGYSGTAIFAKHEPLSVQYGIGIEEFDTEGRVITLEYQEFFLVTCYTPNAQRGLARLNYRMDWDEAFRGYLASLDAKKPLILCGDLNVAHQEIDLKNPKSNRGSAGFSDEERESFTKTLDMGFTDTFRHLHPDATGIYSWWSYMYHARENNAGWRIDYFLVSDRVKEKIYKTPIYTDILGSDHCPVGLEIDLLCNGSLWSPAAPGKARDVTPVKEKKSSPAAKTVLSALLILVALVGGIWTGTLLFPKAEVDIPGSSKDSSISDMINNADLEYFTLTVCTVPLRHTNYQPMESSASYECLSNDSELYLLGATGSQSQPLTESPNFWIRLELTEKGQKRYLRGDYPKIEADSSAIFSIRTYFDRSNIRQVQGWMIFGYIPEPSTLEISYESDTVTANVSPVEVPHQDPFIAHVDNLIVNAEWESAPYDPQIWSTYQFNNTMYVLDAPVYKKVTHRSFNFAVVLLHTDLSREYSDAPGLDYSQNTITSLVMQPIQEITVSATFPAGWIVYGYAKTPVTITVCLGDHSQEISIFPASPQNHLNPLLLGGPLDRESVSLGDGPVDTVSGNDVFCILGDDIIPGDRDNVNFIVVLELTGAGIDAFTPGKLPEVFLIVPPGSTDPGQYGFCWYYNLYDLENPAGWVIYGHYPNGSYLQVDYDMPYVLYLDGIMGDEMDPRPD